MLDLTAKPTTLPSTGQAPDASELAQTPLEGSTDSGGEGFSGLLATSMEAAAENQEVMTDLTQLVGLALDSELPEGGVMLPEGGMMLPDDVAAGALSLPQVTTPQAYSLTQATTPDTASLPNLPQKQALASAVRSLLTPQAAAESEPGRAALAIGAEQQRMGTMHLLGEAGAVQERLLEVARGMESVALVRGATAGGEQLSSTFAPVTLGGVSAASAAGEQAAAKLPPVNVTVGDKGWGQAVGERITWMLGNQVQKAEVRLSPPHLGPLEIKVAVHNDQASVSIAAPHVLTREAIESAIPRLREMMLEGNLNLVNVNVQDRNPGQQNTAGQSSGDDPGTERQHADSMTDDLSEHEQGRPRAIATTLLDDYA